MTRNAAMLNSASLSDCEFLVGDVEEDVPQRKFYAHAYILSIGSPIFWAMFNGKLAETTSGRPVIRVPDVEPDAFYTLLR